MSLKETCVVSKFDGLFTAPVFLVHVKFCSMYQIIASTKAGRYQHSMFFGFRGPNFSAHYLTLGCNQRNLRRMRKHPTKNSDSSRNFPPLQAPSSPVSSRTFDQAPRRGFFKRVEGILSKKTTSSFGGCFFLSLRLKSFEVPFVFLEVGDISYDVCVSMCVLFFFLKFYQLQLGEDERRPLKNRWFFPRQSIASDRFDKSWEGGFHDLRQKLHQRSPQTVCSKQI